MNNIEIWKPVVGYESYYEVSNLGNVRALERMVCDGTIRSAKDVTKRKDNLGYYHVGLNKNGKETTRRIHRLVAQSFIPNPDSKKWIDHINTIRTDNRVENLRWVTPKENNDNKLSRKKSEITAKAFAFSGACQPSAKRVLEYDLKGVFVREWRCARFVAEKLNIDSSGIYACLKGKISHYRDKIYKWKKCDDIPKKIEVNIDPKMIKLLEKKYEIYLYEGRYHPKKLLREIGVL